jgi:hypothetical protein
MIGKGTLFMRKTFYLLILAIYILAIGCSGKWQHPTKPQSEWGKDNFECERMVRESIHESRTTDSYGHEIVLIKNCMKRKGWHR